MKNANNIIPILKTSVPTDPLGIETSTHDVNDVTQNSEVSKTYCLTSSSYIVTLISLALNSGNDNVFYK
jgi:hypothetical protein